VLQSRTTKFDDFSPRSEPTSDSSWEHYRPRGELDGISPKLGGSMRKKTRLLKSGSMLRSRVTSSTLLLFTRSTLTLSSLLGSHWSRSGSLLACSSCPPFLARALHRCSPMLPLRCLAHPLPPPPAPLHDPRRHQRHLVLHLGLFSPTCVHALSSPPILTESCVWWAISARRVVARKMVSHSPFFVSPHRMN
jgi:hypothetical protein